MGPDECQMAELADGTVRTTRPFKERQAAALFFGGHSFDGPLFWWRESSSLARVRVAGQVLYNARNNWVSDSWKRGVDPLPWNRSQHRLVTRSTE